MLAHVLQWPRRPALYALHGRGAGRPSKGGFRLVRRHVEGAPRRLPGRPQGVLLAGVRGLTGRANPAPRVRVRRGRVPRPHQGVESPRTVDVGTGPAASRSTSAFKRPRAHFIAIDISEAALAVARKNADQHGVAGRDRFPAGRSSRSRRR